MNARGTLVIACGALAREIAALRRANRLEQLDVRCLPAELHNRPERIAPAVRAEIRAQRAHYAADLRGLRRLRHRRRARPVLAEEGVERLPGAHCYEFFATPQVFAQLCEAELGTFYLTDFLLRHFERLVVRGARARPPSASSPANTSATTRGSCTSRRCEIPGNIAQGARDRRLLRLRLRVPRHRLRRARHAPDAPSPPSARCPAWPA